MTLPSAQERRLLSLKTCKMRTGCCVLCDHKFQKISSTILPWSLPCNTFTPTTMNMQNYRRIRVLSTVFLGSTTIHSGVGGDEASGESSSGRGSNSRDCDDNISWICWEAIWSHLLRAYSLSHLFSSSSSRGQTVLFLWIWGWLEWESSSWVWGEPRRRWMVSFQSLLPLLRPLPPPFLESGDNCGVGELWLKIFEIESRQSHSGWPHLLLLPWPLWFVVSVCRGFISILHLNPILVKIIQRFPCPSLERIPLTEEREIDRPQ
jgi:hypothetical protein